MKTNGQRLKEARINAGMTQAQAGRLVGMNAPGISHYETDRNVPSVINAIKLCDAYGVWVEDVFKVE